MSMSGDNALVYTMRPGAVSVGNNKLMQLATRSDQENELLCT